MWLKIKWSASGKVVWNSFNVGTFCIIKFKSIEVKSELEKLTFSIGANFGYFIDLGKKRREQDSPG